MIAAGQASPPDPVEAGDSVRRAYQKLVAAFAHAGLPSPEIDARFLLQGVLGQEQGSVLLRGDRVVGPDCAPLNAAARRRIAREPVSRILGVRAFYGRDFEITPDVLDPRPDTETLIEAVLTIAGRKGWRDKSIRIADIGTGSGAIIVTLLCELPLATGVATDVSPAALAVAKRNAERLGVGARLTLVDTSILENVPGPFQIIVANPPYIPGGDIPGLDADVRNYDPHLALDGGPDGLKIYRQIASVVNSLSGDTVTVMEVGAGQAADVAALFAEVSEAGQGVTIGIWKDLAGHERCVTVERQSRSYPAKCVGSTKDTL